MIPARWMVLDRIPRNGTGKTDRTLIRHQFLQEAGADGPAAAPEPSKISTTQSKGAVLNAN
jgi:hypothetical protein